MVIYLVTFEKEAEPMKTTLLAISMLALLGTQALAVPVILEAEDYVASYDAGGVAIHVTACGGASGGLAVEGYDYPGDWIELKVSILETGAYSDMFRSASDDMVYGDHLASIRVEGGNPFATSTYQTLGMGVG